MKIFSTLYIVATPIGNLDDMTFRAIETLKKVDLIACEDTRVTSKLLQNFDIKKELVAYHDHNADQQRPKLIAHLKDGQSIALVSDAGTPLISDPGFKLVRQCIAEGITVIPIPGCSAPITALSAAGLPSDQFSFFGFPPAKSHARQTYFTELARTPGTLIFFESANRLVDCLADLQAILGSRDTVVAREITKKFEEFSHGTPQELAAKFTTKPARGEIVILVGSSQEEVKIDDNIQKLLMATLTSLSVKDAAKLIADVTGVPKKQLYELALDLKK
jgi:16S rRNA (cytidine1402-2'-O)-methyltransferase